MGTVAAVVADHERGRRRAFRQGNKVDQNRTIASVRAKDGPGTLVTDQVKVGTKDTYEADSAYGDRDRSGILVDHRHLLGCARLRELHPAEVQLGGRDGELRLSAGAAQWKSYRGVSSVARYRELAAPRPWSGRREDHRQRASRAGIEGRQTCVRWRDEVAGRADSTNHNCTLLLPGDRVD